ncbi:TPA: hypothetical protein QH074_004313 [Enterobacter hormaechei subsp. steigerwaltii]|nr:hypothetical protein [Enterobacter hormaechei subsp. steigerwaltii]
MTVSKLTALRARRLIAQLEADFPDAHSEGLSGYASQAFMSGVMRTGYPPKKPSKAFDNSPRFLAEANACIAFFLENDLIYHVDPRPSRIALDVDEWRKLIGAYNHACAFKDEVRPHNIGVIALIIAARCVGLTLYFARGSDTPYRAQDLHPPILAISKRSYVAAGFTWRNSTPPALLTCGHL